MKTFKDAFQVATQAERAHQAARLVQPVLSAVRDCSMAQTVNAISDSDTVVLKHAVTDLTNTVKELSKDVSALKLQLHDQRGRSHRTLSPHRCSLTRYNTSGSASYGHPRTKHSDARFPSPDRYKRSPNRHRDLCRRTNDTYQHNDHGERFQDCDYPKYFADFSIDYYEDGRRGRWNDTTSYSSPSFQRRSRSPHQKRVTFEDCRDRHRRPQEPSMDLQSGPQGIYRDHHGHHRGNFH